MPAETSSANRLSLHRDRCHVERTQSRFDRSAAVAWHRLASEEAGNDQHVSRRGVLVYRQLADRVADELGGEILRAGEAVGERLAVDQQLPLARAEGDGAIARGANERPEGRHLRIE